jgi:hypothetical protein
LTEAASNTYCNYEVPIVWSSDSLCHLTLTCIVKTKRHTTYVVSYFQFFNMEGFCASFVSTCMWACHLQSSYPSYRLPIPPLWSPYNLLVTDVEHSDSFRPFYAAIRRELISRV